MITPVSQEEALSAITTLTTSALHSISPAGQAANRLPTSTPKERNCLKDPSAAVVHPGIKCHQAIKKLATKK
ncbi:hypothetical protein GRJ2_002542100 [Grus japonensis]|uniref:Uncharacterized protein n=1 Tax=Grus japonensis TaxID=30415 RepID=A0ABC9XTU4_GRUJA